MSKAVMLSIQPKWCEHIVSGKKTIEVRKTRPSIETPFKVYIYQTKKKWIYRLLEKLGLYQRKVIGEFVCDRVKTIKNYTVDMGGKEHYLLCGGVLQGTCLTGKEIYDYGKGAILYGWHISNLVIYDKPRELGEFRPYCKFAERIDEESFECVSGRRYGCKFKRFDLNPDGSVNLYTCDTKRKITRPPQSWCYVEEE